MASSSRCVEGHVASSDAKAEVNRLLCVVSVDAVEADVVFSVQLPEKLWCYCNGVYARNWPFDKDDRGHHPYVKFVFIRCCNPQLVNHDDGREPVPDARPAGVPPCACGCILKHLHR